MQNRIVWTGDLATKGQLDGEINGVQVAAIKVNNGKITVGYINGMQYATAPATSIKEAKQLAEDAVHLFVNSLGARYFHPDELAVIEAMHANNGGSDEQFWLLLAAIWKMRHMETANMVETINESREELERIVEMQREAALK